MVEGKLKQIMDGSETAPHFIQLVRGMTLAYVKVPNEHNWLLTLRGKHEPKQTQDCTENLHNML